MTDFHSPDFSDRQDALRAMAQPREGEVEFWSRQREAVYGPIEDPSIPRRRLYVPEILSGIGAVMCIAFVLIVTKW